MALLDSYGSGLKGRKSHSYIGELVLKGVVQQSLKNIVSRDLCVFKYRL